MTIAADKTASGIDAMQELFQAVAQRLQQLDMTTTAVDLAGNRLFETSPGCRLCEALRGPQTCRATIEKLGVRAAELSSPAIETTEQGCCIMAVPFRRRRRVLGSVVACFPTDAMLDEEALARLCSQRELDFTSVAEYARKVCRRSDAAAGDLIRVVDWVVEYEQASRVSSSELVTLSSNLAATYEELSLLYRISGSMRVTRLPRDFLQAVCDQLVDVMSIEAAAAWVGDMPGAIGETFVWTGSNDLDSQAVRKACGSLLIEQFDADPSPIVDNECQEGLPEGISNFVAVPIVLNDKSRGMILTINKLGADFDSSEVKLVGSINDQVSIFLANSQLYADLQELLMGVLLALTEAIDAKDPYTCGHSRRVALISKKLAEMSGFEGVEIERVYLSGLLHDVGKIGVPESVLCKAGKLTDEEYESMKSHPRTGAKILGGVRQLSTVIDGVVAHHERPDGRGYPEGLMGDEIPMTGLIVGIADSFDAMTSDRTYRKALPLDVVREEIQKHSGQQFDPDLVEKLLGLDLEAFLQEIRQPSETVFPAALLQECSR